MYEFFTGGGDGEQSILVGDHVDLSPTADTMDNSGNSPSGTNESKSDIRSLVFPPDDNDEVVPHESEDW